MGRTQTIWLDTNKTRTAADLDNAGHCDAFIERLHRDVEFILDDLQLSPDVPRDAEAFLALPELPRDIPRSIRQALFYKKLGLRELKKRKSQLLKI